MIENFEQQMWTVGELILPDLAKVSQLLPPAQAQ